jgi:hypothetical protein
MNASITFYPLRKFSIYSIFVTLIISCVPATQFSGNQSCAPYLSPGDKVLVAALEGKNSTFQIKAIRAALKDRDVQVLYAPEEEWTLRNAGVINPLDTTAYPILLKHGISHILLARPLAAALGDIVAYKTPHELSQESNAYHPYPASAHNVYNAGMMIDLISTKSRQVFSFRAETNINGMEIQGDDGGRTNVNAGSVDQARLIAIRKSARRIAALCK